MAAYLSDAAVAAYCRFHRASDLVGALHNLVAQVTVGLETYPDANHDPALMSHAIQLRRHIAPVSALDA